jgi:hypothetical protein
MGRRAGDGAIGTAYAPSPAKPSLGGNDGCFYNVSDRDEFQNEPK